LIAEQLHYYLPIVFPGYLFKVIVLSSNATEVDFFFDCRENCLNIEAINDRRVIAAWMLANSTAAFAEADFAGINQAGEDLAAIGSSFMSENDCVIGTLVVS